MRDDPPGINRHERAEAMPTCEYAWMETPGQPIFCLAPVEFSVRWHWLVPQKGRPEWDGGQMCSAHIFIACQQLADDPEVEYESIQLMRHGEVE
jgi:hypothetical protein